MAWLEETAQVVERCRGSAGEIQLQRRGREYEIIYNGVFLMASYNGASERAAVREALELVSLPATSPLRVLMGGLGMGCSLQEALDRKQVSRVVVAEIEPAVIRWNRGVLEHINGKALSDPRVVMNNADFMNILKEEAGAAVQDPARRFHVIMVDTDNGSSWLSLSSNAGIYEEEGLKLINRCLYPGGWACFWCSDREVKFERRLKKYFMDVYFRTVPERTGKEGSYYLAGKAKT